MIRVFLIISIFLFSSCAHLKVSGEKKSFQNNPYVSSHFNKEDNDYLYKTKITVFGNTINGIFALKKLGPNHKRFALISDFGNTLIDMEFLNDEITVHYVMPGMDKRLIVNKLKKYFQLLVQTEFNIKAVYSSEIETIYVTKIQRKKTFLTVNEDTNKLKKLRQASSFKDKVIIDFIGTSPQEPDTILFRSMGLPLTMFLDKIEE